ncbi:hypothetical protein SAMN05444394_2649 [Algoriphagus halophilus]|uniref:Uncharacterized protein n=1 Tax=Algoriphagus halophilus TaxID=226505 RepID=A0A1N6FQW1_9BACT|nr:hypothetical protein SAMN05444394_2649 [Algoriphagus halophilus]
MVSALGQGDFILTKNLIKKVILGISMLVFPTILFFPSFSAHASGVYYMQNIKWPLGGSVYRCRPGGNESCDVSGQKHCDEVTPIT